MYVRRALTLLADRRDRGPFRFNPHLDPRTLDCGTVLGRLDRHLGSARARGRGQRDHGRETDVATHRAAIVKYVVSALCPLTGTWALSPNTTMMRCDPGVTFSSRISFLPSPRCVMPGP